MPTSYNGWSASPTLKTRPLVVAGESFSPGIRDNDDVFAVLQYVAQQLHERVEPIVRDDWHQQDDWGFSYRANANDPTSLSNHSSGTAFDYNATRHPNGVPASRNFTATQIKEIHQILSEVNNVVRWGGDYSGTPDAMHFEINGSPGEVAAAAAKIRQKEKEDMALTPEDKQWIRALVKGLSDQIETVRRGSYRRDTRLWERLQKEGLQGDRIEAIVKDLENPRG